MIMDSSQLVVREHPAPQPIRAALLTTAERFAAGLLLVLLLPVLIGVALAVKLTSRGPVVYRQTRVGQYGRTFVIFKFRTMRVGAEHELLALLAAEGQKELQPYMKVTHDPRITSIGKLLRKTSLDELPQLFNVVRGDMRLVGPRPQTPLEVSLYTGVMWRRLLVPPGITGLWQVSGRSALTPADGLALDDEYVKTCSPAMDVRLLFKTFAVVFTQRGAH